MVDTYEHPQSRSIMEESGNYAFHVKVYYIQIAKFAMRGEDLLRALLNVSVENI